MRIFKGLFFKSLLNGGLGQRPEVIRYVAENIGSPLRISDIAARFFVSGNKLSKDFRAFTPIPVHQFIVHVKISIAYTN